MPDSIGLVPHRSKELRKLQELDSSAIFGQSRGPTKRDDQQGQMARKLSESLLSVRLDDDDKEGRVSSILTRCHVPILILNCGYFLFFVPSIWLSFMAYQLLWVI